MANIMELSDEELNQIVNPGGQPIQEQKTPVNPQFSQPVQTQLENDITKVSDEELLGIANAGMETNKDSGASIYSMFNWTGNKWIDIPKKFAIDTMLSPLTEVARGGLKAEAGLYDIIGGTANILKNVSGNILPMEHIENFARNSAEQLRSESEFLPSTGMNNAIKATYQIMGAAPAETLPFLLPGVGGLSTAGKIGVTHALKEYKDEQGLKKSAIDLAQGTSQGMLAIGLINSGVFVLTKAASVWNQYGKNAAKTFLKLSTGDEQLAKDYVDGKIKITKQIDSRTYEEINKAFKTEKENLNIRFTDDLAVLREEERRKAQDLAIRLTEEKSNLMKLNREANEMLKTNNTERLASLQAQSEKTLAEAEKLLKDKAVNTYQPVLTEMDATMKQLSNNIGAIRNQLEKIAPDTGIGYLAKTPVGGKQVPIFDTIEKALMEDFGFTIRNGKIVPKPGGVAVNAEEAAKAQRFLEDLRQFRSEGVVPIGAAYRFHQSASQLADASFKAGNTEAFGMWSRIRTLTEPKNLIVDGEGLIIKSKEGRALLDQLQKANKEFSDYKNAYDAAKMLYTKKNAMGQFEPNPEFAFKAIASGDRKTLGMMAKTDSLLPESQRLFGRVKSLYDDFQSLKSLEEANIVAQKRLLEREKYDLRARAFEAEKNLTRNQKVLSNDEAAKSRAYIRNTRKKMEAERDAAIKNLEASEKSIIYNKMLTSVVSPGKFSQLQIASIAYALGSGNLNAAVVGLALAPKTAKQIADNLLKIQGDRLELIATKEGTEAINKIMQGLHLK